MKLAFLLISLFMSSFGFCQNPRGTENIHFWVNNRISDRGDSGIRLLPFAVNAIVPFSNYFLESHYLFDKWVKGNVVSANNEVINNDSYFFNYDKISGSLLITENLKEIFEINKREFKSFVLKDDEFEYSFEHLYIIDYQSFFQVLVKNNKYSLYKSIHTKYRRSEGYIPSGGFVDSYEYYIVFPGGKLYKKIHLKKRSIIKNLFTEPDKVDAYFSLHEKDSVDEALLIDLINSLNT
jgi:hypothetical protein